MRGTSNERHQTRRRASAPAPHATDHDAVARPRPRGAAELGWDAPAREVIAWVARNFELPAVAVACSMADAVLPALVADQLPGVDVLFLDTGYHFPETYATRDEVAANLRVNVVDVLPEHTVAEQDRLYGARPVRPRPPVLRPAQGGPAPPTLAGYELWFTGVRREEAPTRANTPLITWDEAQRPGQGQPARGLDLRRVARLREPSTRSPCTLSWRRATRPSAAPPAPAPSPPAKTPVPDAGPEPTRQNADYTYEHRQLRRPQRRPGGRASAGSEAVAERRVSRTAVVEALSPICRPVHPRLLRARPSTSSARSSPSSSGPCCCSPAARTPS